MTDTATQTTPSTPPRPKGEAKAEVTDKAAWAIIDAERARREAKTERLRLAREANEAGAASSADAKAQKPKPQKKAGGARRTRSSS